MLQHLSRRGKYALLIGLCFLLAVVGVVLGQRGTANAAPAGNTVSLAQFQQAILVWASGTPAVQEQAAGICQHETLSATHCSGISAAVRATWAAFIEQDPAAVGRPEATPHLTARYALLAALYRQLDTLTNGHIDRIFADTTAVYRVITQPSFIAQVGIHMQPLSSTNLATVWATSFKQTSGLPSGYSAMRSDYVALPDAYLKYADLGLIGTNDIPAIYQPFYVPGGTTAHWTVTITTSKKAVSSVLVTDVGPWNEDDNWWDANGTATTLAANCPVSSSLVAADATSNPLVDGICPNATTSSPTAVNLRRIYYYLLYQHYGLPFFQPAGYQPSGTFSNGVYPTALSLDCAEAATAATTNDGIACGPGLSNYNGNAGGWLRNGTFDHPITNQSAIDLSPAIDRALGWSYPSSGLVTVDLSKLP